MVREFNYYDLDGLIDINTLSPNKEYYYRVTKPHSINPSAWASRIAFFNSKNELIYYNEKVYAYQLATNETGIEYVKWLNNGTVAYFFEFQVPNIYNDVFLDFRKNEILKTKMKRELGYVDENVSFESYYEKYLKDGNVKENFIVDKFKSGGILKPKWYPKI